MPAGRAYRVRTRSRMAKLRMMKRSCPSKRGANGDRPCIARTLSTCRRQQGPPMMSRWVVGGGERTTDTHSEMHFVFFVGKQEAASSSAWAAGGLLRSIAWQKKSGRRAAERSSVALRIAHADGEDGGRGSGGWGLKNEVREDRAVYAVCAIVCRIRIEFVREGRREGQDWERPLLSGRRQAAIAPGGSGRSSGGSGRSLLGGSGG